VTARWAPMPGATASQLTREMTTTIAQRAVVGIVVAMPSEARALTRGARPAFGRPLTVGPQLRLCVGGIGPSGADASCRELLRAGATALVSWGVAAGLDASLRSGTLVLTTQLLDGSTEGAPPTDPERAIATTWAEGVAASLHDAMPIVRGGLTPTVDLVHTRRAKRALSASGGVAADMETAAVARAAVAAGVPWIAMRAIADTARDAVPASVLRAIDERGRVRMGRLALALARHPEEVLLLPALARGYRAALRTLAVVAGRTAPVLAALLDEAEQAANATRRGGAR